MQRLTRLQLLNQVRPMRFSFADNSNPTSWASKLRRDRLASFLRLVPPGTNAISVLDVGGTEEFWLNAWEERCDRLSITLLNVTASPLSGGRSMRSIAGDARDLSCFADKEFDFCFSNSVIEHVGTLGDQKKMADEVQRVARGYFIQTPNRYFVLEPHFHFPGWAQMPVWTRTALHRRMNLGWLKAEPDYLQARMNVEQTRLLSQREFRLLFPRAEMLTEKVGPLTKSFTAIGKYA